MLRGFVLALLIAATGAAHAQAPAPASPLAPLAQWVGGKWVGSLDAGNGRKLTLTRSYEWSFDKRLLIGKSFGELEGKRFQTRETVYYWNGAAKRIEFTDFIDQGGYGTGFIETRDGELYMEAKIVGNDKHAPWRAWIKQDAENQVIRIETERDGKWADFGTYPYKRMP
jgi:hypothetical protein